jgi:alpha-mannosidase
MQGPLTVEERSAQHCVVRFAAGWSDAGHRVDAVVRVHFDRSPLLRWTVEVDSRGTDMSVEMHFVTGIAPGAAGRVAVGMPFDVVTRPVGDTDLLPREAPPELATILLGQRELNVVDTFPFHDFVAVTDGRRTAAILARGLRAYAADVQGVIRLPLRRAVEWLTRADLRNRIGDAGPFFYVPGARCERSERHELAVVCGEFAPESAQMQAINAAFQNPPLLVEVGGHGAQRSWPVLRAEAPLSSLHVYATGRCWRGSTTPPTNRSNLAGPIVRLTCGANLATSLSNSHPRISPPCSCQPSRGRATAGASRSPVAHAVCLARRRRRQPA